MPKLKLLIFLSLSFMLSALALNAHDGKLPHGGEEGQLSEKELNWLAKKHTVRVRVENFAPNYFWEDGEEKGVCLDLLKVIAEKFDFKLDFVRGKTWAEALEDIKAHQTIDLLPAAIYIAERESFLNFSEVYLQMPYVIFLRDDNDEIKSSSDLWGKKVAMPRKFAEQAKFLETYPNIIPVWVDSPDDALRAVSSRNADAYIGGDTAGQFYIANLDIPNLKFIESPDLEEVRYAYAIRKDWPELASLINKGLKLISFEERDAIRSRYLTVTKKVTGTDYNLVLWMLIGGFVVILTVVIWNWTLRLKIRRTTKALENYNMELEEKVAKRTEELSQAKDRLEALFGSMPSAFAEHDVVFNDFGKIVDAIFVTVNEAYLEFISTKESVIDKSVKAVLRGEFGSQWIQLYNKVIELGHPFVFEHYEPTINKFLRVYAFQTSKGRFATLFDDVTEENIATQKLLTSEMCLKEAQRIAKVGNWEYDIKTGEMTCSEGCLKVYGLNPKNNEITMRMFYALVLAEDLDYVQLMINTLIVDCGYQSFEHRVVHPDKSIHNVFQRCEVIPDEHGVPIKVFGTVQNVTAWRKVEDELRSSTSLQEKIIEASYYLLANESLNDNITPALRCLLEGVGASRVYIFENFVNCNGELGCRYNYEVCAKGIEPQIDNPLCKEVLYRDGFERWRELLASGEIISGKVSDFPKEEQSVLEEQGILSLVVVPIEVNGDWAGFIGFDENSIDRYWSPSEIRILKMSATLLGNHFARLEAEKAVKESEASLEMAIVAGNIGLWDWNILQNQVVTNDVWKTMLGYKADELETVAFSDFMPLVHPDDLLYLNECVNKLLDKSSEFTYRVEFRLLGADGVYKWVLSVGKVIEWSAEDKAVRAIGVHIDINEIRQLQHDLVAAKENAEFANRSKSEFLANMSHEIRTPLNAIMGMANLIKGTELSDKQNDYLETIDSSAKSLLNILNDVLDFSKIEAGKLDMEQIDFCLTSLVKNLTNMFQHVAEEKNISFNVKVTEGVPTALVGDPLRLKQVLINLVNNAMKFTDEGRVDVVISLIKAEKSKVDLLFEVSDSGIGIEKGICETLFESFSQADSSTTRKYGGTGLGLSICKRLVEMMNGSIYVESSLGEGSTFTFNSEFLLEGAVDMQTSDKNNIHSFDLTSSKILLVEDSEINQLIMKELLEAKGVCVSCAVNGQEAVDMAVAEDYDLILMDIHMPVLDGYEATREIRKLRGNKIPIVALTANAMVDDIQKCKAAGMNDHISKPVDNKLLLTTLSKWIAKDDKVFNSLSAYENVGGNKVLLEELYLQFFEKFSTAHESMLSALIENNLEEVKSISHTVKGVSGNLGATSLSTIAGKIERAAKSTDYDQLHSLVLDFKNSFACLNEELKNTGVIPSRDMDMPKSEFSSATISMLPVDVLKRLQAALELGDGSQIMKQIDNILDIDECAGLALKKLAVDYEYKQIEEAVTALI